MKINDIKAQLERVLPTQTDLFSDTIPIASITRSGSTATLTTTTPHGMGDGDFGVVVGAESPVIISSLTRVDKIAIAITATPHDLTQNHQKTITITGTAEADYNGVKKVVNAPDILIESITRVGNVATVVTKTDHGFIDNTFFRVTLSGMLETYYNITTDIDSIIDPKTFTFIVHSNPATPATLAGTDVNPSKVVAQHNRNVFFYEVLNAPATPATGSPVLGEKQSSNNGYDGRYSFALVSPTVLTYPITTTPNSPAIGTMVLHKSIRIAGAASTTRALRLYTEERNNRLWAYVTLDDVSISKDRRTVTDATATLAPGDDFRLTALRPFSVVIVTPYNSIAGRPERDLMLDVERFLYKSLFSVQFPPNLSQRMLGAIPIGNGFIETSDFSVNNTAIYMHQFNFEITSYISECDAVDPQFNTAFRTINLKIINDITPIKTEDIIEL
jgi:hypothetical protein